MIRTLRLWLQNHIFYMVWLVLHIAYQVQLELRDYLRTNYNYVKRRLLSCFPLYSQEREFATFVEVASKLHKVPKHLAISVIPDNQESVLAVLLQKLWSFGRSREEKEKRRKGEKEEVEGINLQELSAVIAWASAANIPLISLYDYHGFLKARYKELGSLIQDDITQNFWAVRKQTYSEDDAPPIVKFHNVHRTNGYVNGINGFKSHKTLHISVYSREDGKPAIVNAVKDICSDNFRSSKIHEDSTTVPTLEPRQIDEKTLDSYLNRHKHLSDSVMDAKTDPDLLIILGTVKSTLGFLPWHIRLTEIHWLPTLNKIELKDFCGSLLRYSNCQQRFGT